MAASVKVARPRPNKPVAVKFIAAGTSKEVNRVTAQLQAAGGVLFVGKRLRTPIHDPRKQGRWIVYFNISLAAATTFDLVVFGDGNPTPLKTVPNIRVDPAVPVASAFELNKRLRDRGGPGLLVPNVLITHSPDDKDCLTAYTPSGSLESGESAITQAWLEKPAGTFVQNADYIYSDPVAMFWFAQFPDLTSVPGGGAGNNYTLQVVTDIDSTASYGPVDLEADPSLCDN